MRNDYQIKGEVTEIYLRRRYAPPLVTIIDTEDLPKLEEFSSRFYSINVHPKRQPHVYAVIPIGDKKEYLHRILSQPGEGQVVDHINGDSLDNRKQNLRNVTITENNQNRTRLNSRNTSGISGVYFVPERRKWRAHAKHNGENVHLGYFTDKELARQAVEKYKKEHYKGYIQEIREEKR